MKRIHNNDPRSGPRDDNLELYLEEHLTELVHDPRYWRDLDPHYRAYVTHQFDRVYGGGRLQLDAAGNLGRPRPLCTDIEPYDPPSGVGPRTVGPKAANAARDLRRIAAALAHAGFLSPSHHTADGGEDPGLIASIRAFQQHEGLRADGLVVPMGPTHARLAGRCGAKLPEPASTDGPNANDPYALIG